MHPRHIAYLICHGDKPVCPARTLAQLRCTALVKSRRGLVWYPRAQRHPIESRSDNRHSDSQTAPRLSQSCDRRGLDCWLPAADRSQACATICLAVSRTRVLFLQAETGPCEQACFAPTASLALLKERELGATMHILDRSFSHSSSCRENSILVRSVHVCQ